MRILIDIRHLGGGTPSGVGQYARGLLRALLPLDPTVSYTLLSTGFRKPSLAFPLPLNAKHVHVYAPNRALFASMALGFPKLDKLVKGPFNVVFVPNLHVTPLSDGLPMVLTIHDASWLVNPSWFSPKTRLWHKIVRPKALVDRAMRLIVPSESTAREAQTFLGADPSKIRVIPHGVDPIFSPKPTPQDHGVRSRLHLPKRYALFLATIETRKNVDGIIDAVQSYRNRTGDHLELVLAGSLGRGSGKLPPFAKGGSTTAIGRGPAAAVGGGCHPWPQPRSARPQPPALDHTSRLRHRRRPSGALPIRFRVSISIAHGRVRHAGP